MNITVKHGCGLQSGKIFSVNESVPRHVTYAQLMEGIADGTYTVKSLAGKTYAGQVRDAPNGTLLGELQFEIENNMLSFSLPSSVTVGWPNEPNTYFYDVQETTTATGNVLSKIEGNITVRPSITVETP